MKRTNLLQAAFLFLFSVFLNAQFTYAQSGVLDNSFGTNGKVLTTVVNNTSDDAQSVSIAPGKKIVVAGNTYDVQGYSHIGIVRYQANGNFDKTFGNAGIVTIQYGLANVVLVQPDNKVVIGGALDAGLTNGLGVWRLNSDGSTDSSFGKNGVVSIPLFNFGSAIGYAMTLQPDGKILIGGLAGSNLVVSRLTTSGSLDAGFANNGTFSFTLSKQNLICREIMVQPNSKIIVAGQCDTLDAHPSVNHYMLALRLQPNGSFDSSFGGSGYLRFRKAPQGDYCYSAGLLPDSRIVVAGYSDFSTSAPASVVCIKSNGKVDNSFGTNGWQYVRNKSISESSANATVIEPTGKIILAGTSYPVKGGDAVFLSKLNSNGSFDSTFGNNGQNTFFNSPVVVCNDAKLQADGKIVITGYQLISKDEYLTSRFLNTDTIAAAKVLGVVQKLPAIAGALDVSIYSNPIVNHVLQLSVKASHTYQATIAVYDENGRGIIAPNTSQIVAGISSKTIQLPLQLAAGTYVCLINTAGERRSIKFIVAK